MKTIPIKEVITEIMSGEWGIDPTKNQGVAVIRTANFLNSGQINFSKIIRREIDEKKVSKKKLFSGDIIIEKSGGGPTQPVGRVVLFKNPDDDTYLCNNFTSVLRPNREIVFPEYLFYVLHHNHKKGKTLRYQNKTTGIINLKLDKYLSSEIPLPPLDDQIHIASLLSKVGNMISRRREQLKQLDELLKSVFLEMFGDPVRNDKGWERVTIRDLIVEAKYGTSKSAEGGRYKYLRMNNISSTGFLDFTSIKYIDIDDYEVSKYSLVRNDLVFNRTNSKELVGKTAVYSSDEKVIIAGYLIRVRTTPEANPWYIWGYLNSKAGKLRLFNLCRNIVGMANINAQELQDIPILKPPIELQNHFAVIVTKVESLRVRYTQSLAKIESLYGTLSQKAFNGELDLSRVPLVEEGEPVS